MGTRLSESETPTAQQHKEEIVMKEPLDSKTEVDLLKFFYSQSRDEIKFLRERQDKAFSWASNAFTIIMGALLIIDSSQEMIWDSLGWIGKMAASIAVFAIAVFSVRWQQRNRAWQEENKLVVNKIAILLHCFDEEYYQEEMCESAAASLFPKRWNKDNDEYRRKYNSPVAPQVTVIK
jgi:hypothetical protein